MDGDLFPGRPDHPDFWRLSESVLKQDGRLQEENTSFEEVMAEFVDVDSVTYMAEERAKFILHHVGMTSEHMKGLLMTVYLDAFTTGVSFQKAGGKRD